MIISYIKYFNWFFAYLPKQIHSSSRFWLMTGPSETRRHSRLTIINGPPYRNFHKIQKRCHPAETNETGRTSPLEKFVRFSVGSEISPYGSLASFFLSCTRVFTYVATASKLNLINHFFIRLLLRPSMMVIYHKTEATMCALYTVYAEQLISFLSFLFIIPFRLWWLLIWSVTLYRDFFTSCEVRMKFFRYITVINAYRVPYMTRTFSVWRYFN